MDSDELLARTTEFIRDPDGALDALRILGEADPDGPNGTAVLLTASIAKTWFTLQSRVHFPSRDLTRSEVSLREAERLVSSAPSILANGLVTSARCRDGAKRAVIRRFLEICVEKDVGLLQPLFNEMTIEGEALLIDGNTRAIAEGKTRDDVYRDAETYYRAFQDGDYAGALRGFRHMKSLNPYDAYPRNLIGVILVQQGRTRDGVRELLYAFRLDPGFVDAAANLVRELAEAEAHAAVLEISWHYRRHRRPEAEGKEQQIELYERYSSLILQTLACAVAQVRPAEYDVSAFNVLDELPVSERPWLGEPEHDTSADPSITAATRLFLSYRRADRELVGRLHRRLKTSYPAAHFFLDEVSMFGGNEFAAQIRDEIADASVFLLMIGPEWVSRAGLDRLQATGDVLRREVAWALTKGVTIVPVLLEDAAMPTPALLPESLQRITDLHGERVRAASFNADCARLEAAIVRVVAMRRKLAEGTKQAIDEAFEKEDFEASQGGLEAIIDSYKRTQPKVLTRASSRGKGVSGSLELEGVWECSVTGGEGDVSLRFVLDHPDRLSGIWRTLDFAGGVRESREIAGEWARIFNEPMTKTLGVRLTFVRDGNPTYCEIPFDTLIGKVFVGGDAQGRRYVTHNIEARVGGF